MEIRVELRAVKLGVVEARGVHVTLVEESLAKEMDAVCERLRRIHTVESLPDYEPVRRVRAMFRAWGMDPSKYRPSSEALLRRVAQGKGLYRISNGVDAANLGSIETGWPFGCYDLARISGPITLRRGGRARGTKASAKRPGTSKTARSWPTIPVPSAVRSAIPPAPWSPSKPRICWRLSTSQNKLPPPHSMKRRHDWPSDSRAPLARKR